MSLLVLFLLLACFVAVSLLRLLRFEIDRQEPPLIPQKLPLLGHLFGLLRHGHTYLERLSAQFDLPIYTLQTFTTRIYVVNSPHLVVAVQRNVKNFSFNPFVIAMMPRLFNVGQRDVEIASENRDGEQGNRGYMAELHTGATSILGPGEESKEMVIVMLEAVMEKVDHLARNKGGRKVDLFAWLRYAITMASTEAIFGPESPFKKDPRLEGAFWDFEAQFTNVLLGVAPQYTARKAHTGRARIAKAMQEYFERDGQKRGSRLVKSRYEAGRKSGLSMQAIASFQLGDCIGVLINSVPTTFWMLYHILSSSELLSLIRAELDDTIISSQDLDGSESFTIPVFELQDRCPLLLATYKEVLRYRTHNSSSRYVLRDTLLNDCYLLKANSIIQMPSAVLHTNAELWGTDAGVFNPRRFLHGTRPSSPNLESYAKSTQVSSYFLYPSPSSTSLSSASSSSVSLAPSSSTSPRKASFFRAFGGGATLCPGRHFATCTILATVALILLRAEISPVDATGSEEGKWKEMDQAGGRLASTVPPPDGDLNVQIVPRREGKWAWGFEGGVRRFEV